MEADPGGLVGTARSSVESQAREHAALQGGIICIDDGSTATEPTDVVPVAVLSGDTEQGGHVGEDLQAEALIFSDGTELERRTESSAHNGVSARRSHEAQKGQETAGTESVGMDVDTLSDDTVRDEDTPMRFEPRVAASPVSHGRAPSGTVAVKREISDVEGVEGELSPSACRASIEQNGGLGTPGSNSPDMAPSSNGLHHTLLAREAPELAQQAGSADPLEPEPEPTRISYRPCPCLRCTELLLNEERLEVHMRNCHNRGICEQVVLDISLKDQIDQEHTNRFCPFCEAAVLESPLDEHIEQEHTCKVGQCDFMGSKQELADHMRRVHPDPACNLCPYLCEDVELLNPEAVEQHIHLVHTCSICQEPYPELDFHMQQMHEDAMKCAFCSDGPFPSEASLQQHLSACRAACDTYPGNDPVTRCPKCGKKFLGMKSDQIQRHAEDCNVDPKPQRKRGPPDRFSPTRAIASQQGLKRTARNQRHGKQPECSPTDWGPAGRLTLESPTTHEACLGMRYHAESSRAAELRHQLPADSPLPGADGHLFGGDRPMLLHSLPPQRPPPTLSVHAAPATLGVPKTLCSATEVVREMGLQSSAQEEQPDDGGEGHAGRDSPGMSGSVSQNQDLASCGDGMNDGDIAQSAGAASSHKLMSCDDLEAGTPIGGELTLGIVLDKNLKHSRQAAAGKDALSASPTQKIRVLIPDHSPPTWVGGEPKQPSCACGKGHDAAAVCDCVKSLTALLETELGRPVDYHYNLPKYLHNIGKCRAGRVLHDDPRIQLRGARRLVAASKLQPGDVLQVYQGFMMSEAGYLALKNTPPRWWEKSASEWATMCESYALDMTSYNTQILPVDSRQSQNKLVLHTFRWGNETSCTNDPAVISCAEDIDGWNSHKWQNGDLGGSNVRVLSHNHPPNRFGNVVLQEFLIFGWPYPFLVVVHDVEPGEELLLQYGHKYWTAMTESGGLLDQ